MGTYLRAVWDSLLQLIHQEVVLHMKKAFLLILCVAVFTTIAAAQTYKSGSGITGVDKLGAHQNGGKGCVGCHAPHSGARGNGGNAATGSADVTDPNTGDYALWGQDLGPLYTKTLAFGDSGSFPITLPADSEANERLTTGVMMCLSCHDGNLAKGAMMANASYEQSAGLLPANTYGTRTIPTLLGNDGTAGNNYKNDHPIGPLANLKAVGLVDSTATPAVARVVFAAGGCKTHGVASDCLQPNAADANYLAFVDHYGSFNVTQTSTAYPAGGRAQPLVLPSGNAEEAYVVCTTCHTPHSMYTFSGTAAKVKGTYPSYFFIAAPYNPAAPVAGAVSGKASSATQFCRQCHFTGAGGANEGSGIMTVTTAF